MTPDQIDESGIKTSNIVTQILGNFHNSEINNKSLMIQVQIVVSKTMETLEK